ncbi:MAG: vitamin K epoxide reductase family protein [Thermoplasmata archaeon]|nr:vitamin K epoxide reductase family protein [Thermoplasmata archaeon]
MRTRTFRSLVYFGGGFGLIASFYAAAEIVDAELSKACSFNQYFSCATILESGKTTTLGIPDYAWGIVGFVAILVLGVLAEQRRRDARFTYLLLGLTTAGVALSLYLLYIEVVEIGGICPVCVTAYFFGWLAWGGAIGLALRAYRREHRASDGAGTAA